MKKKCEKIKGKMTTSKEETKETTSWIGVKSPNRYHTESTTRDAGEKEEGAVVGSVVDI